METNRFQCKKCLKKFDTKIRLRQHRHQVLCKKKICRNCEAEFRRVRDLVRYEKNRQNIKCNHCNNTFCNNEHFQKHIRTITESKKEEYIELDVPINSKSGYEDTDGFKNIVRKHKAEITNHERLGRRYKLINKKNQFIIYIS